MKFKYNFEFGYALNWFVSKEINEILSPFDCSLSNGHIISFVLSDLSKLSKL